MTYVVEIACLFAEARDNQTKVVGTPNDDHVVKFKEDLLNVCLHISFGDTDAVNPSGAILKDARYQVAVLTSTPYNRQVAARANYDPNLKVKYPALHAKEENLVASTRNQSRKRTINCGANDYLLNLVDPTWLRPLNNNITFFTRVTHIEMIANLTKTSGILKRVDTVDLLVSLTKLC